jgi:hypothetical protein
MPDVSTTVPNSSGADANRYSRTGSAVRELSEPMLDEELEGNALVLELELLTLETLEVLALDTEELMELLLGELEEDELIDEELDDEELAEDWLDADAEELVVKNRVIELSLELEVIHCVLELRLDGNALVLELDDDDDENLAVLEDGLDMLDELDDELP